MSLAIKAFVAPLIVACAMFMESVDANVIVTAIPEMAKAFGRDPVTLKIAVTSYVLGLGVFIPICGWVADRFGARTIFRLAIGIFVAGSLLCVRPPRADPVHARAFRPGRRRRDDGTGRADHHLPLGAPLRIHPRDELPLAARQFGPAVGPLLDGFITTYLHWRLIFFINIPIGILSIYLTNRYIGNAREPHPEPLDWFSFFLSASGGTLFLLGLSLIGGELVSNRTAAGMALAGVAFFIVYFLHSRRVKLPLLDLLFLRVPTFQASVSGGSLFASA